LPKIVSTLLLTISLITTTLFANLTTNSSHAFFSPQKNTISTLINPISAGYSAGESLAIVDTKIDLDKLIGDNKSANMHRGARDTAIASMLIPAGKIVKLGDRYFTKIGAKEIEIPKSVVYDNKGIYNPKAVKGYLESKYGKENIMSFTIPNSPQMASSTREDVIIGNSGAKSVKVKYNNEIKNIPYDNRDLPIFDDVAKYTTTIEKPANWENMSEKARRSAEMRAATRQLRDDIKAGRVDAGQFTEEQLTKIKSGSSSIPGYTWHHNAQSAPNNMQLVPSKIHNVKEGGIPHTGEGSMSR
jgi:filamentous hemagglutinin